MFFFAFTVIIASAATIAPIYKIKGFFVWLLKIPILGWVLNISYGLIVSTLLLRLFAFQSTMAGLANLTSTFVFAAWIYLESKNHERKKQLKKGAI